MKFTLEQFDFSNLKPDSILMITVSGFNKATQDSAQKTVSAMKQTGKIPKETLCLITNEANPIKIRELPPEIMNQYGWIKMKMTVENAAPQSPAPAAPHTPSDLTRPS